MRGTFISAIALALTLLTSAPVLAENVVLGVTDTCATPELMQRLIEMQNTLDPANALKRVNNGAQILHACIPGSQVVGKGLQKGEAENTHGTWIIRAVLVGGFVTVNGVVEVSPPVARYAAFRLKTSPHTHLFTFGRDISVEAGIYPDR